MAKISFWCSLGLCTWSHIFNIHLCDLFIIKSDTDAASLADDNTTKKSAENTNSLVKSLESTACRIFKWFLYNQLRGNVDKYHVLLSTKEKVVINVKSAQTENNHF